MKIFFILLGTALPVMLGMASPQSYFVFMTGDKTEFRESTKDPFHRLSVQNYYPLRGTIRTSKNAVAGIHLPEVGNILLGKESVLFLGNAGECRVELISGSMRVFLQPKYNCHIGSVSGAFLSLGSESNHDIAFYFPIAGRQTRIDFYSRASWKLMGLSVESPSVLVGALVTEKKKREKHYRTSQEWIALVKGQDLTLPTPLADLERQR